MLDTWYGHRCDLVLVEKFFLARVDLSEELDRAAHHRWQEDSTYYRRISIVNAEKAYPCVLELDTRWTWTQQY